MLLTLTGDADNAVESRNIRNVKKKLVRPHLSSFEMIDCDGPLADVCITC